MSDTARIEGGPVPAAGNVVLAFGPQPMDWFSKAGKLTGRDAVMDQDVARMAGATLAAGSPVALAALRKRLEAGALQAARAAAPQASEAAMQWLASGERGMSSTAMFQHLTGVVCTRHVGDGKAHPYDPADLRRCRLLLEQVPELQGLLPKMVHLSGPWARLVRDWDAICSTMDAEAPNWRTPNGEIAPKTYELIQVAIKEPPL